MARVVSASDFFVAPSGSPAGNGTLEQPWDLQTALDHPTNVAAGDTIWLRGGIYRKNNRPTLFTSALSGAPDQPIVVRRSPGERAIIDGNISQNTGGFVDYWGFEIMNSHPNRLTGESGPFPTTFKLVQGGQTNDFCVSGFDLRAPEVKLINLVIHDSIGGGIGANDQAQNAVFTGVLSFYNGWQGCDRSHGHGLYTQNVAPSYVFIGDCLFFANYALGIQATSNEGRVDNFYMQGSALFFNGVLARRHQANFLLGPFLRQANNSFIFQNFVYDTQGTDADVNIGYQGGIYNPQLYNNYFQTSVHFSPSNQLASVIGNQFLGGTRFLDQDEFPENAYSTNRPENNVIEVRHNSHEVSRLHVIVYNWENAPAVPVDLSFFISPGSEFEVRTAQDFLGAPVLSETYTGGVVQLPMTGLRVAKPIGTNAPASTAPEFNAFVILLKETSPWGTETNSAPTLSAIKNQVTAQNVPTGVIPFVISDAEMPPEFLTLSVHSSRTEVVPNANLQFSGQGTNRTLKIVPMPDEIGTAVITLTVSDGFLTATNVFLVKVNAPDASSFLDLDEIEEDVPVLLTIGDSPTKLLTVQGPLEMKYDVQASTNLVDWSFLGTVAIDCSGMAHFQDEDASEYPARFYRLGTNSVPDFPDN